jgi:hypothetical protein
MTPPDGPLGGAGALGALERSGFGQAMREALWLYPAIETVHLAGIALLFGSIVVFDLRLLGLSRAIPVRQLARHVLPWSAGSFLLIVPSGLLMFSAHASEFIANPVFALKLCLIGLGLLNAALFHTMVYRSADVWDAPEMRDLPMPPSARASAIVSLLVWTAVIACGRLLAYT